MPPPSLLKFRTDGNNNKPKKQTAPSISPQELKKLPEVKKAPKLLKPLEKSKTDRTSDSNSKHKKQPVAKSETPEKSTTPPSPNFTKIQPTKIQPTKITPINGSNEKLFFENLTTKQKNDPEFMKRMFNSRLQLEVKKFKDEINQLKATINQRDHKITKLNSEIKSRDNQIRSLNEELRIDKNMSEHHVRLITTENEELKRKITILQSKNNNSADKPTTDKTSLKKTIFDDEEEKSVDKSTSDNEGESPESNELEVIDLHDEDEIFKDDEQATVKEEKAEVTKVDSTKKEKKKKKRKNSDVQANSDQKLFAEQLPVKRPRKVLDPKLKYRDIFKAIENTHYFLSIYSFQKFCCITRWFTPTEEQLGIFQIK